MGVSMKNPQNLAQVLTTDPTQGCYPPYEVAKNLVDKGPNPLGPLYLQKPQLIAPLYAFLKAHCLEICSSTYNFKLA